MPTTTVKALRELLKSLTPLGHRLRVAFWLEAEHPQTRVLREFLNQPALMNAVDNLTIPLEDLAGFFSDRNVACVTVPSSIAEPMYVAHGEQKLQHLAATLISSYLSDATLINLASSSKATVEGEAVGGALGEILRKELIQRIAKITGISAECLRASSPFSSIRYYHKLYARILTIRPYLEPTKLTIKHLICLSGEVAALELLLVSEPSFDFANTERTVVPLHHNPSYFPNICVSYFHWVVASGSITAMKLVQRRLELHQYDVASFNQTTSCLTNLLHLATLSGNAAAVMYVIREWKVNPDTTINGRNALHLAVTLGNLRLMQLLAYRYSLDPNISDFLVYYLCALHLAANNGNPQAMLLCYDWGIHPQSGSPSSLFGTAIHDAATGGSVAAMELARSRGCDPHELSNIGNVLHCAARAGHIAAMRLAKSWKVAAVTEHDNALRGAINSKNLDAIVFVIMELKVSNLSLAYDSSDRSSYYVDIIEGGYMTQESYDAARQVAGFTRMQIDAACIAYEEKRKALCFVAAATSVVRGAVAPADEDRGAGVGLIP